MMKRLTIRCTLWLVTVGLMICCRVAVAQSPTVLYTWDGTGHIHDWISAGSSQVNETVLTNNIAGELTVTELGDPVLGEEGGRIVIQDGHNRRLESATASGGLDVTGLSAIELDIGHNGTDNVNAQFFVQTDPFGPYLYIWAGNDGARGGPDFSLSPGMQTIQFPLGILSGPEQAHIRSIGVSIRDHFDQGNLTWTVSELRTIGPALTLRDLVTHDVGTSDNGLQGAFANFDRGAIVGNDGGPNQTGLSQNTDGSGSLQWTDRGGTNLLMDEDDNIIDPSGAAITWGNGTAWRGNSFNERLTDLSNYTHVTYTISAMDPLDAGGILTFQAFYQTQPETEYVYQTAGDSAIPIDGEFHDVTFPLASITDRDNVQTSGLNLFAHENDLVINVDRIRYEMIEGVPGDYNEDGTVNAADYTVWRDLMGQMVALPNEAVTPNMVDIEDYNYWVQHFGETLPGGGATVAAVPELDTFALGMLALAGGWLARRKSRW